MRRPSASVTLPIALVLGVAAEWVALRPAPLELPASPVDIRLAMADFTAGAVLLIAGRIVIGTAAAARVGYLLTAAGVAWFLGTLSTSGTAGYADVGAVFVTLHRGPLVHALLSSPDGRLRDRADRAVVAAVYGISAVTPLARTGVALAGTAALLAFAVARRLGQPTAAPTVAVGGLAVVLAGSAAVVAAGHGEPADRAVLWAYDLVVTASAAIVAGDIRLRRWARSTVTQLVVELGSGGALRDRLARALGDSSLEVGYVLPGRNEFVDDRGLAVAVGSRTVTPLGGTAVLIHDAPVNDPALLAGVAAAAQIAVTNARLQSEVRRQVAELVASRRRLVEATDAQRRRIEAAIRRGPERALAQAGELLADVVPESPRIAAALADVRAELANARDELRAFARGVHPRTLTENGLAAALGDLTRRGPLSVELDVPALRLPRAVEETAYFVCAEALANASKHARAAHVVIHARERGERLELAVEDDGVGEADPAGAGLRGLSDRVEVVGGSFHVFSEPGRGTRVVAELPQR